MSQPSSPTRAMRFYCPSTVGLNHPRSPRSTAPRAGFGRRWLAALALLWTWLLVPTALAQVALSGVSAVTTGFSHTCALVGGGVKCWGKNDYGQLGDNSTTQRVTAVDVNGLTSGVSAIVAGQYHSCALTTGGGVKCWGRNDFGQLGDNSTTQRLTAVDVSGLTSGVAAITAGQFHTCALTTGNGVKCWGKNGNGQLGDNSISTRLTAVDVSGLTSGVSAISAGQAHTCALTSGGGMKCWGFNDQGQMGDNSTSQRLTPVDVSGLTSGVAAIAAGYYHTCALTTGNGVKCWGYNGNSEVGDNSTTDRLTPVDVTGLTSGVSAISSGQSHACAVTSGGGAKCWGRNNTGQLGDTTLIDRLTAVDVSGLTSGVASISVGAGHNCVQTTGNGAKCWGNNLNGQLGDNSTTLRYTPVNVTGLSSGVTAITPGYEHSCAVVSGGAKCWGRNHQGQLGDNSTTQRLTAVDVNGLTSGVSQLAVGQTHSCALTTGGGVKCWGKNDMGQVGDSSNSQRLTAVDVTGLTSGVSAIVAGNDHTCALVSGAVKCWGYNGYGQLGDNSTVDRNAPVTVSGLSGVTAIAAGQYHTCALASGGMKCWGDNSSGQLGDNTSTQRLTAVDVSGLTSGVSAIAAGSSHSCALTSGGGVKCWGDNSAGKLGDNSTTQRLTAVDVSGLTSGVAAISAGGSHTCALTTGNGAKCWGYNGYGQVGDNSSTDRLTAVDVSGLTSGVTSITAGQNHTCALISGAMKCWGYSDQGQIGDGTTNNVSPFPVVSLQISATAPGAPTIGTATAGNTSATVAFTAPGSNGGSAITGYTATSNPGGLTSSGCTASPCTVNGLTNGTAYTFTVTATNGVGTGSASAASNSVTPTVTTAPGAPTIGTATAGNTSATVAFTAPGSNGGSAITGYTATSSPGGLTSSGCTASPCTVSGLTNGTAYTFTVTATNGVGTGSASGASNSVTPATTPGAPTIGTATAGNTSATVAFTAPAANGSAITGYTATSSPGGLTSSGCTVSPCTVNGLTNGTAYTFTVTATNGVGTGSASGASNSVTPATTPGAPTIGTATAGNTSATVAFTAPGSNGGNAITGYTATSSPGGITSSGCTVSPCTVNGLTNGTAYTFTVTATNGVGTGSASSASNSVTPTAVTVPGAPTIGTATAGNTSATVAFTAPGSNGGSAITGYTATSNPGGLTSSGCTVSPCTVNGLTNGTAYTFTVTATNGVGTGSASGASNSVTPVAPPPPATVPGAPTIGVATAGAASATVAFAAPSSNGGSAITGYTATSSPGGFTSSGCTGSPCTVTGLTNGTAYTFTVTASNSVGTSSASAASNSVTPLAKPGAPTVVKATAGSRRATVEFTAPASNGGSPITGYTATSSPGGITGSCTASPCTVTGLTNGTAYTFTVTATNAAGIGSASAASNSVTPLATVPGAPVIGPATAGNGSATITFAAPAETGDSPITAYTATSSPGGITGRCADSPCTVTGLTNGTAYTFTVTATNAIGTSSASAASNSVTPVVKAVRSNWLAAGSDHTCAQTRSGLKCWGFNFFGQLGNNTTAQKSPTPVDVVSLAGRVVDELAAGSRHTCALIGGGVKCWGGNATGELGNGSTKDSLTAVDVSGLTSGVTAIAAGHAYTCALTARGGVKCWGYNGSGQLTAGDYDDFDFYRSSPVDIRGATNGVAAIAAGHSHACALTTAGGVKCWGGINDPFGYNPGATDVAGLTSGVIAITAGHDHTCALNNQGGVKCWGNNRYGQLGDNSLSSGMVAIKAGGYHTCALTSAGTVKCWGRNASGQLNSDGLTGVVAIAAGYEHSCAATSDGAIKCWGSNFNGQLGDGTTSNAFAPIAVSLPVVTTQNAATGGSTALTTTNPVVAQPGSTLVVNTPSAVNGTPVTFSGAGGSPTSVVTGSNRIAVVPNTVDAQLRLTAVQGTTVPSLTNGSVTVSGTSGQPLLAVGSSAVVLNSGANTGVTATTQGGGTTVQVNSGSVTLPATANNTSGTLYAGETATFDASGKLTGIVISANNARLDQSTPRLNGQTMLDALKQTVASTAQTAVSSGGQNANGTVSLSLGATKVSFSPQGASVDNTLKDGMTVRPDGSIAIVNSGVQVIVTPTISEVERLAGVLPTATVQVGQNGLITIQLGGESYSLRPSWFVDAANGRNRPAANEPYFVNGQGQIVFVLQSGEQQVLYPAIADYNRLLDVLNALDPQSTVSIAGDGSLTVKLNGVTYRLLPDYQSTTTTRSEDYWFENGKLYLRYTDGKAQGLKLLP